MGASATIILLGVSAGVAVDGYVKAEEGRKEAGKAQERQRIAQENIQSEQRAKNAQSAQEERIRQRREFIRKSAMMRQAAQNTGTAGSSGEYGAFAGLETGLSTAIGSNLGAQSGAERISGLAQDNATAGFDFQTSTSNQQSGMSQLNLGMSLFQMGAGAMKPTPTVNPVSDIPDLKLPGFQYDPNTP